AERAEPVHERPRARRREHPERDAAYGGKEERGDGEDEGGPEADQHLAEHRLAQPDGPAEIALAHVGHPARVLQRERLVEPHVGPHARHVLLALLRPDRHLGGVSWGRRGAAAEPRGRAEPAWSGRW